MSSLQSNKYGRNAYRYEYVQRGINNAEASHAEVFLRALNWQQKKFLLLCTEPIQRTCIKGLADHSQALGHDVRLVAKMVGGQKYSTCAQYGRIV